MAVDSAEPECAHRSAARGLLISSHPGIRFGLHPERAVKKGAFVRSVVEIKRGLQA